jgi:hypothetical protein
VALAVLLSACATLDVVPPEHLHDQQLAPNAQAVGHIHAVNWGVYLFKYIPIATGDLRRPGVPAWPAWFSNEVTAENIVDAVSDASRRHGGTMLTDLVTHDASGWLSWSLILWLREYEASANASRVPVAGDE